MSVAWIVAKCMQMYAELIRQLHLAMVSYFSKLFTKFLLMLIPFIKYPSSYDNSFLCKYKRLLIWKHTFAPNLPSVATVLGTLKLSSLCNSTFTSSGEL